jgi:hypothetical protein
VVAALLFVTVLTAGAAARPSLRPENLTPPALGDSFRQGSTLTASNGTWTQTPPPASFAYQWQRCASDGAGCTDLQGQTSRTYTPVAADVGRTLTVTVTATNSDGTNDATSDPSPLIASTNGPSNDVQPAISGTAQLGQILSVTNGIWIPPASTYTYQWQLCASDGSGCLNSTGATKQTYQLGTESVSHTLRVLVTAHTAAGEVATTFSNTTGKVAPAAARPTTTTTTPTGTTGTTAPATTTPTTSTPATTAPKASAKPPTVMVLSLRRAGTRIRASFRVCDGRGGVIAITARDSKAKTVPKTHRFNVHVLSCGNVHESWPLLARFRGAGRFVVSVQAKNPAGKLSKAASRSLVFK